MFVILIIFIAFIKRKEMKISSIGLYLSPWRSTGADILRLPKIRLVVPPPHMLISYHAKNLRKRPTITILTVTTKNMIFECKVFAESDVSVFSGISLQMIDTLFLAILRHIFLLLPSRAVYQGPSIVGLRLV